MVKPFMMSEGLHNQLIGLKKRSRKDETAPWAESCIADWTVNNVNYMSTIIGK